MNILGIDGSIVNTGIVIISPNKKMDAFKVKHSEVLHPKSKGHNRYIEMQNKIENILMIYEPELVLAEDIFPSINRSGKPMIMFHGSLRTILTKNRCKNFFIPNQTLKKFFTDNAKASKEEMIKKAKTFDGVFDIIEEKDEEHVADAFACAFMGFCSVMPNKDSLDPYRLSKVEIILESIKE